MTRTLSTVLGGQLLQDVQTFVAALDTMFGGFRERADQTYALLKDSETAFLVVAAPERDALREASFFAGRLDDGGHAARRAGGQPHPAGGRPRAHRLAGPRRRRGAHRRRQARRPRRPRRPACCACTPPSPETADRQRRLVSRFTAGHPGIPVVEVPAAAQDIHDLDGLREVGAALDGRLSRPPLRRHRRAGHQG